MFLSHPSCYHFLPAGQQKLNPNTQDITQINEKIAVQQANIICISLSQYDIAFKTLQLLARRNERVLHA